MSARSGTRAVGRGRHDAGLANLARFSRHGGADSLRELQQDLPRIGRRIKYDDLTRSQQGQVEYMESRTRRRRNRGE